MYVALPDGSKVWCRKCSCNASNGGHSLTCEFYIDYANALTDFVYADDTPEEVPSVDNLH